MNYLWEAPMSKSGQNAKYPLRANVFRYAPHKRTSTGTNVMSEKCQKQKLTPARTADDWRDENPTELVPVKTDDGAGGYADPAGDKAFGKAGSRLQRR
jgi:hypothetical protein